MADILEFPGQEPSREQLLEQLALVRQAIADLDRREPKNMNGEAYEAWGDEHEELEDQADALLDLLDKLK